MQRVFTRLSCLLCLITLTGVAHASGFPRLAFQMQGQFTVLGGVTQPGSHFGLSAVQANGSMAGFGLALEAGYERLPTSDAEHLNGGYLGLAAQLRFITWLHPTLFRYVDPHLDLGLLGGATHRGALESRGAAWWGGGLDLPLGYQNRDDLHLVFTAQYRATLSQSPSEVPERWALFGLGLRFAD